MKARVVALAALGFCLWTFPSQAETPSPIAAPATATSTAARGYLRTEPAPTTAQAQLAQRTDPSLSRVSIALGLLFALGAVAIYARRRRSPGGALRTQVRLHSLAALQLTPKSKVALVSVGREALLLGVTEQGISCLRCYPEDELWSLTTALPGFGDAIREQEEQEKLARRPKIERSIMDRGMDKAFSELLKKAGKDQAPTDVPSDEFVPSELRAMSSDKKLQRPSTEELPPHLVALLAETHSPPAVTHTHPRSPKGGTVVPFPSPHSDSFSDLDGQALELARRFSELGK